MEKMKFRKALGIMIALLAILPGVTRNFTPIVQAYTPLPEEVTSAPNKPYHIFSNSICLFIGTGGGKVYRSSDDGATWTKVLDTENPNVQCYLLEDDAQGNLYTSFDNCKLYRSTDNGDSWEVVFQCTDPPVYFPTGEFFDMKNGTILAAARSDEPLLYRSDDWGANWNLWINFSQVFPEYSQLDPSNPSNKAMKHLHLVTFFNGSFFVSTGEYVRYHFKSVADDLTQNSSWRVDCLSTFTSEFTMDDRILLGVDMGDKGIFMYKNGEYKKVYNPNKEVSPYIVFKHFAHDLENDIIYVPIGYSFDPDQTILASPDKGETWFNFVNITQTSYYGIVQVEVHKNYLWYVIGYKTYKLPKPSRAELINSVKADTLSLNACENVHSYTSSVGKAYKSVNVTLSNLTWTNLAPNPSFETFSGSNPTNWTFYAGQWSGSVSRGEETGDVYHGSKACYIEAINGSGSVYTCSNVFSVDAGYYYLGVHFKANSSWFKGAVKLALYAYTDGWKTRTLNLHSLNGTWQQGGLSFYSTATQNAKIYLFIESPNDYNLTTRVIFDSLILVGDEIDRAFQLEYWIGNLTSTIGSIEINGETFDFSSLPTTISLAQCLVGEINATLTNAKLVNLTISGIEVVTIQNGSLTGLQNNVYKGIHYIGFSITKNTENRLMVFSDQVSTVSAISLSTNKLFFTVSAPSGTTSSTKVYCGHKGKPSSVSGADSWSYDNSTKILTAITSHSSNVQVLISWEGAVYVDLNSLIFENFQKWDALLTRYLSLNGTITDKWDRAQAPSYSHTTLSGAWYYLLSLATFYEEKKGDYYLRKLQSIIDEHIDNPWYRATTDIGTIHYVPGYYYGGVENDASALFFAPTGVGAIKLHEWTGNSKYKTYADDLATESQLLVAVSNSTDMAWNGQYKNTPRNATTAKTGVNRQGAIGYFYSLYARYNSTFGSFVPKIFNWIWRAQVDDGGLGYNIGDAKAGLDYTAFSTWFVMNAYQNVPSQFSSTLKAKINNTITWMTQIAGSGTYLRNAIVGSALAMAVESGFISNPSSAFLNKTKTYIYVALKTLTYGIKGLQTSVSDYPEGYRWGQLFLGALLSTYPLPSSLVTYSSPHVTFKNYETGRYYWEGYGLDFEASQILHVGDIYHNNGLYRYPYLLLGTKQGTGTKTRSITNLNGIGKAWLNYSTTPKALTYYYPDASIFINVSGTSKTMVYGGLAPSNFCLRVANGTEYNLNDLSSGTYLLSPSWMLWRNHTDIADRNTILIHTNKTSTWKYTKGADMTWESSTTLTNYNVSIAYIAKWSSTLNSSATFMLLEARAKNINTLTPLTLDEVLTNWNTETESRNPSSSWFNIYQSAVTTKTKLIAHNSPEKVSISAWSSNSNKLTFTVSAPSGIISTTKIYCGDKGEPREVYSSNGTLTWVYNSSTKILTLNVVHDGAANILVDWRILGDANGDGKVNYSDLFDLSKVYGFKRGDLEWTTDCDFNWDGKIDVSDMFELSKNYEKI